MCKFVKTVRNQPCNVVLHYTVMSMQNLTPVVSRFVNAYMSLCEWPHADACQFIW